MPSEMSALEDPPAENGRVVTDDNVGPLLTGMARGITAGLSITLGHFWSTLTDYLRGSPNRGRGADGGVVQHPSDHGSFTVQYPEERLTVPENFRYLPVLIYEEETGKERCTSCGICAKVCPPQCIWIVRTAGPDGKPIPEPAEFTIDVSICMSCGYCAEYCPFDAIKMDHRYELANFERKESLLHRKQQLMVSTAYYAKIHPTDWAAEEAERLAKEAAAREKAAAAAAAKAASAPAEPKPAEAG
jgi:NADH-quinone oxidoreductase subunit I